MKNKFAKIFENENEQVVLMKCATENGGPALSMTIDNRYVNCHATQINAYATQILGFDTKNKRDNAFDNLTDEDIFPVVKKLREFLNSDGN